MTPYLMESLMTKRGWTLQMINKVIKNCNSAWKTSVAPVQNTRYNDEIDTDEELGPMPRTEDNTGAAVQLQSLVKRCTLRENPQCRPDWKPEW